MAAVTADAPVPEADCAEGGRHPRFAPEVYGQDTAIDLWLEAEASGRRHHAWLLTGPKGIGKATLAWKLAAHVLSDAADGMFGGPTRAEIARGPDPESGLMRRIAALSEPRLKLLRRGWDAKAERHKSNIAVDDVRELRNFFQMSAADGGARVVIVDAADEMNTAAANALLKSLEEPPPGAVFLLIAESPAGLLPTIQSRCRRLACASLSEDLIEKALFGSDAASEVGLAALSLGSAGTALRLAQHDGAGVYRDILNIFRTRGHDRDAAHRLAETLAGKGQSERQDIAFDLIQTFVARLALAGARGAVPEPVAADEPALLARLAPTPVLGRRWADLVADLGPKLRHGRAVNLDPGLLLLDTIRRIDAVASGL